ncbi:hypothetical protein SLEP1_g41018 [Rubroshorea leprosula]|uniref:Uncharacterized protein n=1 Tax=Rubroshorea leprosula TaxID=152421 RepID=A0AAV5L598_9ROSI|nr:hypothetical protein SLEP1_g41018 [Rubroshorea leprosula]
MSDPEGTLLGSTLYPSARRWPPDVFNRSSRRFSKI